MTEEEKRKLALSIMAAEQERLKSSSFTAYRAAEASRAQERINANQALFHPSPRTAVPHVHDRHILRLAVRDFIPQIVDIQIKDMIRAEIGRAHV